MSQVAPAGHDSHSRPPTLTQPWQGFDPIDSRYARCAFGRSLSARALDLHHPFDEPHPLHRVLLGGSSTTGVMLSLVAVDKTFSNDRGTIAECDQTGWSSGSEALALSEATSLLAGGAPRL